MPCSDQGFGPGRPRYPGAMDQSRTPVLDAIEQYRREDKYTFALPGHRLGLGIDDRTAAVLSRGAFEADVITAKQAVSEAERLFAPAGGARQGVFTPRGSGIFLPPPTP